MTIEELELPEEDRQEIRAALLAWKAEGVEKPLIPMDVDVDSDGIADSFGLDENDNLILVSGASLEDTVYQSTGEGIETEEDGEPE